MMLVCGVSIRMLPLLERHMRDAEGAGAVPAAGCVLVTHSEHEGGVGGGEVRPTVATVYHAGLLQIGNG